ncbi:MAG: NAD(P)/FAD-dependent oxidoreductase [Pseudomonadaceae bacterium]|nr:NAD(P)/FAD-dependent oxidoreductase [Pseudomonadaceae bacterium]
MRDEFDVIVIGAGNAGLAVARTSSQAGLSVAVIESDTFGGTCPNRGCTPKKILVAAAQALDQINHAHHHGIDVSVPALDWAQLIQRQQGMIAHIPEAMQQAAESFAETFCGQAQFVGPQDIEVNGQRIRGKHIVIATGSSPRQLSIPGAEYLVNSDDLLTNTTLPSHLVFIGGGVIALEFAHVFARAGTSVTILEALPQLLPRMDADAVASLREATESIGVTIVTDVTVEGIHAEDSGLRVTYRAGTQVVEIAADKVANGTGRVPNVAHLNLSAANVEHNGRTITTDAFFRSTSNPYIWVVGDALSSTAQLSPLATREGKQVGEYIVRGIPETISSDVIPQALHTIPPLASVGLTETEARQRYPDLVVQTTDMKDWFSSRTYAEDTAWAKVLIDGATDQLVGAHLVGHRGDDLIHLFTLAINHKIGRSSLQNTAFAFPTFSSDIKNL